MNILITDGNNRSCLAITRSLGKAGYNIFISEKENPSLSSVSRYCTGIHTHPNPILNSEDYLSSTINFIKDNDINLIIPVSDITTLLLAKYSEKLPASCKLPLSDYKLISDVANKAYIYELAKEIGIGVPESIILNNANELEEYSKFITYPVVIKPSRSRVFANGKWIFTSVTYAKNKSELKYKLNLIDSSVFPVLLQERITGPGVGVFLIADHGKVMQVFSHKRNREKPPSGGVSVLRESIVPNETALKYSISIVEKLKWHGVAMVEFKMDQLDKQPKLMEINGRFWGSLQLAIDAGVDFPKMLVDLVCNNEIKTVSQYKIGVKSRWLVGDLDLLLMLLFKSRNNLNLPPGYPGKIKSIFEFSKFWSPNLHYEVLNFSDIKPWLLEIRRWLLNKS